MVADQVLVAGEELVEGRVEEADGGDLGPVRAVHDGGYLGFLEQAWSQWSPTRSFRSRTSATL